MTTVITVDGVQYRKIEQPIGNREIVVLDRGFIFVGNVSNEGENTLRISNAQNIRKWEQNGFGGMCLNPKDAMTTCDPCADVICSVSAPIFRVPVPDDWNN